MVYAWLDLVFNTHRESWFGMETIGSDMVLVGGRMVRRGNLSGKLTNYDRKQSNQQISCTRMIQQTLTVLLFVPSPQIDREHYFS